MSNVLQQIKSLLGRMHIMRESYDKKGVRPLRDWRIILLFVYIISICIAVFSYLFYSQINQGKLFIGGVNISDTKTISINQDLLKKVIDDLKQKEANLTTIKQGKITKPDPSL